MRLTLRAGEDIAALVRAAEGPSIVVVIPPIADGLTLAVTRAAIAPLAIERAPAMRVNAVLVGAAAASADVDAAVAFLDGAGSTTGQIVEIS